MKSIIRRPVTSRHMVAALIALNLGTMGALVYRSLTTSGIQLDVTATPAAHRPLVLMPSGGVKQMPTGDYLDPTTLVDTTGCSATNVIKWDGTKFSCGAGGGGGGITNSAGAGIMMKSDGTNAVTSAIADTGSLIRVTQEPLQGWSTTGGTQDYYFDPNGISFIDSVVGAGGHGTGTDETLAIGWTGAPPLRGTLDVRTNGNTITASTNTSGAAFISNTDTVNTGSTPTNSYGLDVENVSGRGTGTGALTTYGIRVDNPGNGQTNYGIYVTRGGETIAAGGMSVLAGASSFQGLTATTIHGTGNMTVDTSITVGSTVLNTSNLTTSQINVGNAQIFGGSTNMDFYIPSASNQVFNFDSSGTGAINFNSNVDGITNSGTGGVNFGPGNNSSLLGTRIPGTGEIRDVGTLPTLSGCGTSPTVTGGGYSGRVTTGSGATTCVVTFATAMHTTGSCNIQDEAGSVPAFTPSTTSLSFTATASHSYDYECKGH